MTSKATNQRDLTDVIKKQKRDGKKAAGIIRAQASGISGADTAITSGQKTSAGGAGGSPVTQDLQMNTFDIRDVDRLYFSTTAGSADALTANDTGIESASYYDGTNYYSLGMNYRIPSPAAGMGHYFLIGSEQCLTVKNDKIEVKKPLRLTTGTATGSYLSGSMYYDGTDVKAVVPAGTVNLTSGGAGWDGDATSILDMNDYAIQHTGQISFGATSGTYANIDSSSDSTVMNFAVNGLSAMALTESSGDSILELKGSPNPVLKLRSTDGTPSDNQTVGGLYFDAFNSSAALKTFGSLKMETADVTAGSEDGAFMMNLMNGGTSTNVLLFDNDRLLPQTSDDYDLGGAANRFKFAYIKFPTSVEQLSFSSAISGQYINSSTAGLQYYVPSGDSHVFEVVSTPVVTITATQTTFHDDVEVVGNLDNGSGHNDNFVWSGTGYANISATNTYLYSATTYLGNSGGGDLTYIYSELDFKANHSSVNQTLPTHSDGYITIKVGGITRKLYYYN